MRLTPHPARRRAVLVSAALTLLATSCSQDPEQPSNQVQDLLQRSPSRQQVTDADMVPVGLDQWGPHDGGGWASFVDSGKNGFPRSVRISLDSATLLLETTGARERSLELTAWSKPTGLPLQLQLNGVPLERVQLQDKPSKQTVHVPAAFWQRGLNQLELTPIKAEGQAGTVSVAELQVTPANGLDKTPAGLQLDPQTQASWQLELAGPGLVDFELSSPAEGTASVVLSAIDPATGAEQQLETRELELPSETPLVGRILLPEPEGRVLELSAAWQADDAAEPLSLSRLELFEQEPLARPSILFISIDTLAAANLSIYGYSRPTTPRLSELVADSVLFEAARSNAPWTIPSYSSQFTGLYARANTNPDIREADRSFPWKLYRLGDSRWTLVEMLRAAGYRTGAFVDNLWLARIPGFTQGFETFDPKAALMGTRGPDNGMRIVLPSTLEFLEQHAGEPTFAFAQIVDIHGPYHPQPPFKGTFADTIDPDSVTMLPIVRGAPPVFGGIPDSIAEGRFAKGELPSTYGAEYFQADYDEKVLELDSELGKFLDQLKARGLYDDLMIVFSADHGEAMIDHEFNFRHGVVYDSAIHVPLVIKMPHQESAGTRVSTPVQLVDLYPTLADVLGLPAERSYLHGRSLLPAIKSSPLVDLPLLAQGDIMEQTSLVLGPWKLVVAIPEVTAIDSLLSYTGFQERLFEADPELFGELFGGPPPIDPNKVVADLAELKQRDPKGLWKVKLELSACKPIKQLFNTESDPKELTDVSAEHPELVAKLTELLRQENQKAVSMQTDEKSADVQVSGEMLEELKRLGYVGND